MLGDGYTLRAGCVGGQVYTEGGGVGGLEHLG